MGGGSLKIMVEFGVVGFFVAEHQEIERLVRPPADQVAGNQRLQRGHADYQLGRIHFRLPWACFFTQ